MTAEPFCPVCGTVCGDDCPGPIVLSPPERRVLQRLAKHGTKRSYRIPSAEAAPLPRRDWPGLKPARPTTAPEGAETEEES